MLYILLDKAQRTIWRNKHLTEGGVHFSIFHFHGFLIYLWKIPNKRNTDEWRSWICMYYYASKHNIDLVPLLHLKWESVNLKPTADSTVQ